MTCGPDRSGSGSSAPVGSRPSSPRSSPTCRTCRCAPSPTRTAAAADLAQAPRRRGRTTRGATCSPTTDVDVVVVATPPASHAAIATAALRGRQARVLREAARHSTRRRRRAGRDAASAPAGSLVVDHVLRYNPLLPRAGAAAGASCSGRCSGSCFENDASDEDLGARPLVLGRGRERRHLRRARRALLRRRGHAARPAGHLACRPSRPARPHGPVDLVCATVRARRGRPGHPHPLVHPRAPVRAAADAARPRRRRGPGRGLDPGRRAWSTRWTDDAGVARRGGSARPHGRAARTSPASGSARRAGIARRRRPGRRRAPAPAAAAPTLDVPHHVRIDLTLGGPRRQAGRRTPRACAPR